MRLPISLQVQVPVNAQQQRLSESSRQKLLPATAGCAASLTLLAKEAAKSSKDTTFSQYAAAVLNSLVYLLKDCLERLQDIHNIEASMADEKAWHALPPRQAHLSHC